jgi:hypothetical protein
MRTLQLAILFPRLELCLRTRLSRLLLEIGILWASLSSQARETGLLIGSGYLPTSQQRHPMCRVASKLNFQVVRTLFEGNHNVSLCKINL